MLLIVEWSAVSMVRSGVPLLNETAVTLPVTTLLLVPTSTCLPSRPAA